MKTKTPLAGLNSEELLELLAPLGFKQYQIRQLMSWIYQRNAAGFDVMTDISKELRSKLESGFQVHGLTVIRRAGSSDGTVKLLLEAGDDQRIESVLIPGEGRLTACLSSQAGCKLKCAFCATGRMGFSRNLTSFEIVDQLCLLQNLSPEQRITNVVFMGMGEPLQNYEQVLKAARLINSHLGFNLGARHITISTAGLVPGILKLAGEPEQFKLAVSLNAPNDQVRSRLMPVNKKYPLKELMEAAGRYASQKGKLVFFEYILLSGVNDSLADADSLARLIKHVPGKVNLIPYNPGKKDDPFRPSSPSVRHAFFDRLHKLGVRATIRLSKGGDIQAACGQLKAAESL
jgi:23S rRNA (adenine2503-C2)-methyltransferase